MCQFIVQIPEEVIQYIKSFLFCSYTSIKRNQESLNAHVHVEDIAPVAALVCFCRAFIVTDYLSLHKNKSWKKIHLFDLFK